MAYSIQRVTSTGTLVLLAVTLDYFDRSEITVRFDGNPDAYPWHWVGSTDKTIAFNPAIPNGVEVTLIRTTNMAAPRHDFSAGAAFIAKTMDENFEQALHVVQEARELASTALETIPETLVATEGQLVFNLTNAYQVGNNSLAVYCDGLRLVLGKDYTEVGSKQVDLLEGAMALAEYTFVMGKEISGTGTGGGGGGTPIIPTATEVTCVPKAPLTGVNVQSALDEIAMAIGTPSSPNNFQQVGPGTVVRTMNDKAAEIYTAKDTGAKGNGTANDGPAIAQALTNVANLNMPSGQYINQASIVLPFGKSIEFEGAANIVNTGPGSSVYSGVVIRKNHNPSGQTGWTDTRDGYNYEGLSVDLGGYGNKQFGAKGIVTGIAGATKVPSTSTIANHSAGVAGYCSSASTTTGAVGVYAEGNTKATNALAWGANTLVNDNGFASTIWGAEIDVNCTNASSVPIGCNVVGGSTVEPANSIAFWCGALGAFTSPKKKWARAFLSGDGCATTALEVGTLNESARSPSQDAAWYSTNSGGARVKAGSVYSDADGNFIIQSKKSDSILGLTASDLSCPIKIMAGNQMSFFGGVPTAKPTVSGSISAVPALASLVAALAQLGLINNLTTM